MEQNTLRKDKLKNVCRKTGRIMPKVIPIGFVLGILLVWQLVCTLELVPDFLLPSPIKVFDTLWKELPVLLPHLSTTLIEALAGLVISIVLAFICAVLMDRFKTIYLGLYPILVFTQTIPAVAIAPLLILWLGFDMLPKIVLIVIVCFFPMTVNWLEGFKSVDPDVLKMLATMKAKRWQVFWLVKFKSATASFFAGLKIAVSYAVVGGVIAEWLGGSSGLGVYMTQVRKMYAYDKMFAVIILVSLLSLFMLWITSLISTAMMPWQRREKF